MPLKAYVPAYRIIFAASVLLLISGLGQIGVQLVIGRWNLLSTFAPLVTGLVGLIVTFALRNSKSLKLK